MTLLNSRTIFIESPLKPHVAYRGYHDKKVCQYILDFICLKGNSNYIPAQKIQPFLFALRNAVSNKIKLI